MKVTFELGDDAKFKLMNETLEQIVGNRLFLADIITEIRKGVHNAEFANSCNSDLSMEEWQKLSDEVLNTDFDDKTLDYLFEKPSLCEAVRRYRLMKENKSI